MTMDAMTLSVLHHRFEGIARKMANTLLRAGRSGVLNRARDFSCCIVTRSCELLTAAESLPIHVLSGPDIMARRMRELHPDLQRGDAFLNNSPYDGCSHPADHTILVPVIDEHGGHRFTVVAKAHQADIGNSIPSTYHAAARDVYEEGALIFPSVQVQRGFRSIEDWMRVCRLRIRVPEQWHGDYLALIGAARIGEIELERLAAELGWDTLREFAEQWLAYSEQRAALVISRMPAGEALAETVHDAVPGIVPEPIRLTAYVRVDRVAGFIEVDLSGNPDAMPCGLNLSEACARTAALIGVFNSLDGDVPKNSGSIRRIRVQLRENCIAGIPKHPTSCSVATTNVADRIGGAVQLAMSRINPSTGMAECGPVLPPSASVISGLHPETGERFVNQLFLGCTGGAARADGDGWLTYCHLGNGGLCFIDSVELDELYLPLLISERRLVADSEGPGKFCGAPGLRVEFKPLDCSFVIAYGSDGTCHPAQGANGGLCGGRAAQFIRRATGMLESLPAFAQVEVLPHESVVSISSGGGGYEDPRTRDRGAVARDVEEGLISAQKAAEVYGWIPTGSSVAGSS